MFYIGDKVAVMPKSGGADVIAIDTVAHVDAEFVQTKDGGLFRANDGESISKPGAIYIVPATVEHFSAVRLRVKPR